MADGGNTFGSHFGRSTPRETPAHERTTLPLQRAKCRRAGVGKRVRSSLPSFHQSQPRIVPHPGPKPPCHLVQVLGASRCTAVPELSESWPPQRTPLCLVSHVLVRDLAEKGEAYGRGTLRVEQRRINAMRNRRGSSKLHIISLQHFFVKKSTSTSSWLASDETASMYRPSEPPTLPWLARAPSSRRCEWSETVISPVRESGCSGNLGLPQGAVHWRFQPGPKPSLSQHRHPIQSKEHHLPTPTYLPAPSLP